MDTVCRYEAISCKQHKLLIRSCDILVGHGKDTVGVFGNALLHKGDSFKMADRAIET